MKKHLLFFIVVGTAAYLFLNTDASTAVILGLVAVLTLFFARFGLSQTRAGRAMKVRNPVTGRLAKKRPRRDRRELDDRPAILYICTHRKYGAIKVGIGDDSGRRLADHEAQGWRVNRVYKDLDRGYAFKVEQTVLRKWRKRGYAGYLSPEYMPQGGHTETASLDHVSFEETCAYVEKLLGVKRSRVFPRRRRATVGLAD